MTRFVSLPKQSLDRNISIMEMPNAIIPADACPNPTHTAAAIQLTEQMGAWQNYKRRQEILDGFGVINF